VIIRPINRTRYSSVYLALSESREEQVALKVLDRRGHDVDEDALERFRSEYEIGCSIEGPHVAEVYEFGVQDDLAFIALEYFAGGDLKKRMEQPMLPRHCVRLLRQIAEALEAIHEAGIIHGDLKPGNIMMRADGSIALIDFGLSRQSGGAAAKETIVEGTPLYLSPERADGLEADERGDLYALGAIFYQMLIGEPPFNGASATEVIGAHRSQPIPRLASPLDRYHFVLDGLLEKHPEHRIGSAAELLVALDHFDAYLVAEAG
jgi:serine/threonine-protein kinase PpkA